MSYEQNYESKSPAAKESPAAAASSPSKATHDFSDLLGPTLLRGSDEVKTSAALAGKKAVALYFSAHWCGPCRGFTPHLAKAYSMHLAAKGFEVIFVSSDRDQPSFADYYKDMPWLAVPFSARDVKAKLSKKFKVQGIPSLVIMDGSTGKLITKDGREEVINDPRGANFPWTPPTIWEALGDELLSGTDGDTVEVADLRGEGKYIGLYFSAHWCPPCKAFTPVLAKAYKEHLKAKGLEVIFVSSDRSSGEFGSYYATMPWLAIPNGDKRKKALDKMFGVEGIPTFVLIDANTGETISANARGGVTGDPTGENFPWLPKPLADLSTENPEGINEETALVVLLEGCDDETTKAAIAVLEPIAKAAKAKGDGMLFFYASTEGRVGSQIRSLTKSGNASATPKLLLLDIPDEGAYFVSPATTCTTDTVTSFLEAYKAGMLERKQLGS